MIHTLLFAVVFAVGVAAGRWYTLDALRRRNSVRAKKSANTRRERKDSEFDAALRAAVKEAATSGRPRNLDVGPPHDVTWTPAVGSDV